jgi:hypothetical protein
VRLYNTVKKDPELEEILEARKLQPDTEEVQKPIPHMKSTPIIRIIYHIIFLFFY